MKRVNFLPVLTVRGGRRSRRRDCPASHSGRTANVACLPLIPDNLRLAHTARIQRADERAAKLALVIKDIQATDVTSLRGIARVLNERRVRTPWGRRRWYGIQVARVLERIVD